MHDNDRKGCFDAGEFPPDAASALLLRPSQWPVWLCRTRLMVVGPTVDAAKQFPELGWQPPQVQVKRKNLWVLERSQLISHGLVPLTLCFIDHAGTHSSRFLDGLRPRRHGPCCWPTRA